MRSDLYAQKSVTSTTQSPTQQADIARLNTICGSLVILFPLVVYGAIVIYRKHQTRMMQQQIQRLNRIWRLNSSETLS